MAAWLLNKQHLAQNTAVKDCAGNVTSTIIESAAWMDTLGAVQKHGTFGGIGHCLQTFRSAWVAPLNARNRTLKAAKVLIESGVGSVDAQPTAGNWQCVASWNQAQPDSMMVNAQADAHP